MKQFGPTQHRQRRSQDPQWKRFFNPEDEAQAAARKRQEALDTSLADTGLSLRIVNALEDRGIYQAKELAKRTRDDLLSISNFGDQTLRECKHVLDRLEIAHPNWNKPPRRRRKAKKKSKKKARQPVADKTQNHLEFWREMDRRKKIKAKAKAKRKARPKSAPLDQGLVGLSELKEALRKDRAAAEKRAIAIVASARTLKTKKRAAKIAVKKGKPKR